MYVLEVIPLSRTAPPMPLSYRSSTAFPAGTLVKVPLRKQTVLGLVVSSEPVQDAKAALKTASFMLAKSSPKKFGHVPGAIVAAAMAAATYHATTLGSVLAALLVPVATEDIPQRVTKGAGFEVLRAEMPLVDREKEYAQLITSGVTLLIVPTLAEARTFAERFKKAKPLVLTSALTPKKREAAFADALNASIKDQLVIATPGFAYIPLPRLSRIIIERMSAGGYLLPKRPYIDVRIALTELARARAIPLMYADYPLPLEYRQQPEKPLRTASPTEVSILDARVALEQKKWVAVPDEVKEEMGAALAAGGSVGVLAVRKGYAPSVVCRDCGTAVTDEYGRTLSLVTSEGTRMLRSADGRTLVDIRGSKVLCKNCGSWNLQPLGVGIELVAEELRNAFPGTELILVEADTLTAKVRKELQTPSEHGRLLVGTELMLPWISPKQLALGVIASADSLLAVPFWRARERFVRVALMLAERSEKLVVVTRREEDTALSAISSPTTSAFWKEEAGMRKILKYPPYGTLIVFHIEGTAEHITEIEHYLQEACAPRSLISLPAKAISKAMLRSTSVLQLPAGNWPDEKLVQRFSLLPPSVRVHIDSESFF